MNKTVSAVLALIFLLGTATISAEIYTWTDENGVKHFGDAIPAKYRSQGEALQLVVPKAAQQSEAEALAERKKNIERIYSPSRSSAEATPYKLPEPFQYQAPPVKPKTCSQKQAEYYAAVQCFSECRAGVGVMPGERPKIVKKCSCRNLKKPKC